MSLIGTIAINMKVNTKQFVDGLKGVRKDLATFASTVQTIGVGLTAFGAAGAVAIGKTILAASNLEEQADRVRDQFGAASKQVIDFSNLMGTAFGIAKKDSLQAAASFAALFEGAGYTEKAVADLSIHFVKLGTDISRFVNLPIQEALTKLKSGLAGESEAIRQLGVSMLESDVKAYAYAHGIAKLNAELTSSEKIQARVGYLTERFTKAYGNLAKTGDKVAGAIEGAKGRFENLAATIGESFLLIASPVLGELQVAIQAIQSAWLAAANAAVDSSQVAVEGLTAEHHSIGPVQAAIGKIADGWQLVGIVFSGVQLTITEGIGRMVSTFGILENTIRKVANLIPGVKLDPGVFETFADTFEEMLTDQKANVAKLIKAPWASEAINASFEQGRKDIQAARDKLLKAGKLDVLSIKPGLNPAAVAGKEHRGFAHAATFGEAEAANAILQNRFGVPGGKNGATEQTAKNTAKANMYLEQIARKLGIAPAAAAAALDAF